MKAKCAMERLGSRIMQQPPEPIRIGKPEYGVVSYSTSLTEGPGEGHFDFTLPQK
jgi:hypothetical protein